MVKHEVVPPDGRECVGAAVAPADALHKVLVSPIAQSADGRVVSVCGRRRENRVWSLRVETHSGRSSEFRTAREQSSLTEASMGVLERTGTQVKCPREARADESVGVCAYLCVE